MDKVFFLNLKSIYKNAIFYIFIISIVLTKFPPFYIFPVFTKVFTSHSVIKIIFFSLFFLLYFSNRSKFINIYHNKILIFLISLYFLSQSLSIISASDIILFWKSYHNIFIGILIFIISYYYSKLRHYNQIINKVVLVTGVVLVFLELSFNVITNILIHIFKILIQKEVYYAYLENIARGRNSLDLNIELFFPIFVSYFLANNGSISPIKRYLAIIICFILIFLSFISNFRSRVLAVLFSTITSFFLIYLFKYNLKKKTLLILSSIILIISPIIALYISNLNNSFNVIDRFLLTDKSDYYTANYRLQAAEKSFDLFLSSPLIGIGLGNYGFYRDNSSDFNYYIPSQEYQVVYTKDASYSTHDIFTQILAETGLFGISSFLSLLIYFCYRDLMFILKYRMFNLTTAYILSYWTMLVYFLFNPSSTIFTLGWFWFIRGIKEGHQDSHYENSNIT